LNFKYLLEKIVTNTILLIFKENKIKKLGTENVRKPLKTSQNFIVYRKC